MCALMMLCVNHTVKARLHYGFQVARVREPSESLYTLRHDAISYTELSSA